MRLKGGAKGIDLATLMYENKRMAERFHLFDSFTRENFALLFEIQAYIKSSVDRNAQLAQEMSTDSMKAGAGEAFQESAAIIRSLAKEMYQEASSYSQV